MASPSSSPLSFRRRLPHPHSHGKTLLVTVLPNLGLPLLLPPPRPRAPSPHTASPSRAEKLTDPSQLPSPLCTRLLGGGARSHGGDPEPAEDEEGDVCRICSDDEHPLRYPCASIKYVHQHCLLPPVRGTSELDSFFINLTFSFAPSPAYLPCFCILGRVNKRYMHDEIQVAKFVEIGLPELILMVLNEVIFLMVAADAEKTTPEALEVPSL